jgi:hypothetical protein
MDSLQATYNFRGMGFALNEKARVEIDTGFFD